MNDIIIFWSDCIKRRRSQLTMHIQTLNVLWDGSHNTLYCEQQCWVEEARKKLRHAEAVIDLLRKLETHHNTQKARHEKQSV